MGITIGSDVELAIHHNNVPVDVTGMLGGSKDEPVWFDDFNIQEDNVNAEYAINPVQSLDDSRAHVPCPDPDQHPQYGKSPFLENCFNFARFRKLSEREGSSAFHILAPLPGGRNHRLHPPGFHHIFRSPPPCKHTEQP